MKYNISFLRGLTIITTAIYFIGNMIFPMKDPMQYLQLYLINTIIAINFLFMNFALQRNEYAISVAGTFSVILQFILIGVAFNQNFIFQITL